MNNYVKTVLINDRDRDAITKLVLELNDYSGIEELILNSKILSYRMPASIIVPVTEFKYKEDFHVLKFQNLPFPDDLRQPTPVDLGDVKKGKLSMDELQLLLIASAIGDPFTWNSIQSGNLINNVFPIRKNENKTISSNAVIDFGLHTEDAFHKYSGDYLLLFGYKNLGKIPTTVVYIDNNTFSDNLKKELFKENFIIKQNSAHEIHNFEYESTSILFGHFDHPFIRINLNEEKTIGINSSAKEALNEVMDIFERSKTFLPIDNNELVLIDNFRTVHGRDKFIPAYDGTDRWLKRIYITRDIRKSIDLRSGTLNNIISL